MFGNESIDFDILRKRAFNLRWASVPEGVIPLTAADPDFPCPPQIVEAIQKFAAERYFSYGNPEGMSEFKEAAAAFFAHKRNVSVSPAHVLPVDSAAFGIHVVCKTFLKPGDEAIIFDPVDFLFRYCIEQAGAKAITFPIPPGNTQLALDALEACITSRTKLICLCNPLNPTGKVFSKQELYAIGMLAVKYNIKILSDEIWSDIVFPPAVYTSVASIDEEIRRHCIIVTGFSKSYGLAGLRIGLLAVADEVTFRLLLENSLHNSTVHGANIISQVAAATALNSCGDWLASFVNHLHQMRDYCVTQLNALPGVHCHPPDGCYVAFANIKETGKSSAEVHQWLLKEARVAVVPGLTQWFGEGAEGYIRISFATSKTVLESAFDRIHHCFHQKIKILP